MLISEVDAAMTGVLACQTAEELEAAETLAKEKSNRVEHVWALLARSFTDVAAAYSLREKRLLSAADKEKKQKAQMEEKAAKNAEKERLRLIKDQQAVALKAMKSGKSIPTAFDVDPIKYGNPMLEFESSPDESFKGLEPCIVRNCAALVKDTEDLPGFTGSLAKFQEDARVN